VPCPTVVVPDDDNANAGALTFNVNEVVAVSDPDVPVIVMVLCPTAAEELAVNVTKEVLVAGFAEKTAVTPAGRPEMARLTLPLNPYSPLTYMYVEEELPCPTVVAPEFERVNVGAITFSVREVVAVSDPDVPVIVMVLAPRAAAELAVNVTKE